MISLYKTYEITIFQHNTKTTMKKLLFTLALMLVTFTANAQCNCKHEPVRYLYIYATIGGKNDIKICDGTEGKNYNHHDFLDENGNKIYVNSKDGLRNYFTLQGWEYIKDEGGYLFLRKAVSEEEANAFLPKLINQNK